MRKSLKRAARRTHGDDVYDKWHVIGRVMTIVAIVIGVAVMTTASGEVA